MRIRTLDEWYEVRNKKEGVIFNESGPKYSLSSPRRRNPILHRPHCSKVQRMRYHTSGSLDKYYFQNFKEADEWLRKNRPGLKIDYCNECILIPSDFSE